jgi:hypothetical protein
MYTQEEYLYGWLAYLAGVLILILCGWIITAKIPWAGLRGLIRTIAIVTLLVPWYADAEMTYLAPAWIIAAFEGIFEDNFLRAGGPLLSALAVALAVDVVVRAILFFKGRKAEAS